MQKRIDFGYMHQNPPSDGVWTWEDPSGTWKELVTRTLDVRLSRALSTGAGALWCLPSTSSYSLNCHPDYCPLRQYSFS